MHIHPAVRCIPIRPRSGFTLIEMLLVVAIISLLIALLLPSMSRIKEITRRTVCANNQHQIFNAVSGYALNNHGRLPSHTGHAGNWLWDLNSSTVKTLQSHGMAREMFTCPSNTLLSHNDFWLGGPFDANGYIIGGYMWLIRHPGPTGTLANGPAMLNGKLWQTRIKPRDTTHAELSFDPVVFSTTTASWTFFGHRNAGSTSHMDNPHTPAGANVSHLDGRVAWRPFRDCTFNATFGPQTWW